MNAFVADTSAFAAILFQEPDAGRYLELLDRAETIHFSAATRVELHLVVSSRFGAEGVVRIQQILAGPKFQTVSVDEEIHRLAVQAFTRFGKGRHPAGLNFGDLFSYATAKSLGLPLLFKGEDFARTDIVSAILSS